MESAAERTNADWVRVLAQPDPEGDAARAELRALLVRGLRRALAKREARALELVEDFAQEALLRVLSTLEGFRGEGRFTSWAMAVAMRVAFNELRRQRWGEVSLDAVHPVAGPSPELLMDPAPTPEQETARRAILAALRRALEEELTPRQRQVLVAELQGMPQEELARQLGTNRNALYKLGHDARRKLQRALVEAGLSATFIHWAFD
ncbi:sigma-70 family RNA polymerase sigma factor [Hyalangium versicolor]|uniref:sigma-70 family RNA polymerase sigma factor n=1 Tax=Hyalangium versicolor TaxID=2861190 RepID=UPI001CCB35D6|nr:sigma-70 family RNA polymerase sigma factor [Hyalangium versicolor]